MKVSLNVIATVGTVFAVAVAIAVVVSLNQYAEDMWNSNEANEYSTGASSVESLVAIITGIFQALQASAMNLERTVQIASHSLALGTTKLRRLQRAEQHPVHADVPSCDWDKGRAERAYIGAGAHGQQ